ncbi:MAG: gamma-glutamyl-gamma-aminobutyrate hydrolase family protein [Cyanobacteria bacterium J06633_2]
MDILVVQNSTLDPIGVLGNHLVHRGAQLFTWLPETQTNPANGFAESNYAGLVVLGGPMNAHEDEKFPHLQQTVNLIHQFHAANKPIMGICLGAQLVARAFGSQVYPHHVPELGFSPLRVIEAGTQEPWLQNIPENLHLMQWHFDTFDLPTQATLLMTNDICSHQAYRIGSTVYGFQFHLEVTPDMVLSWLAAKQDWIDTHHPGLDQQIKSQLQVYAQSSDQFAEAVAQYWLDLISTPILSEIS